MHQVFLWVLLDHPCTELLAIPLWIIRSEAELFVIGTYHLRQIWVDTKETANFFETIFKVRGEECVHSLVSTIKPNTSEVFNTVYFMNDAILLFNQFDKDLTCFCAELQVPEESASPFPSFAISIPLGVGIICNKSGLLGNSQAVTSFHRFKDCFNMSS